MKDTGAQPKRRTQMESFIGRTQSLQVTWTSEMKHKSEKPQLWLYPLCYTNLSAIRVIVLFQHSLRLFKPILERTFAVPPPHKIILPRENWCFLWAVVRADCMQPGDSGKGASLEPPHHPMRGTATWAPCLRNFQSLFHYAVLLGGSEFAFSKPRDWYFLKPLQESVAGMKLWGRTGVQCGYSYELTAVLLCSWSSLNFAVGQRQCKDVHEQELYTP